MSKIKLSAKYSMSAIDYANQGNSIIGIRGSGKTYGASNIAEQLLDNNIPIIVFDPTGVWQNLRNGVNGHPGYPVVVAGGMFPDLPLNESNAVSIVEAALKASVSLVIDLKGMSTSNKSSWMRIVSSCVEFLMGNNDQYGLRHVFIEEAAEFVPQKPNPGGQLVYSRIESLARMGRNFGLGYTLINQRAEEIAKAIFEISEQVMVFRQAGKNSLKSISDWLDYRGLNDKGIVGTLPRLDNGQCWIINEKEEVQINIPVKKTFHPDPKARKANLPAGTKTADRSAFIEEMKKAMEKPEPIKQKKETIQSPEKSKTLKDIYANEVVSLKNQLLTANTTIRNLQAQIRKMGINMQKIYELSKASMITEDTTYNETKPAKSETIGHYGGTAIPKIDIKVVQNATSNSPQVTGGALRMLKAAAMFYPETITKMRMAALAGLSHTSGSFSTYISTLKRQGFMNMVESNVFIATQDGINAVGEFDPLPTSPDELIGMWCNVVGNNGGAARILRAVAESYPHEITKTNLGEIVEMSSTSGSFSTYLSTLKRNGLITVAGANVKAADELFN